MEIVRLTSDYLPAVCALFARIASDEDAMHFHPHAFNDYEAMRVCEQARNDLYFAMVDRAELIGYGMLRGWDEGYAIPALGIYVVPERRGTGAGRKFMESMHRSAKLAGATRVRLKVHATNVAAMRLYQSMGYQFGETIGSESQIVGYLDLTGV